MSPHLQLCALKYASVAIAALLLSACGGGGGGGGNNPPPPGGSVTVSGKITFDRPPFRAQLTTGLDLDNPVESPARHVVVEALDASSNAVLASTTTDTSGDYSLSVPAGRNVFIRAKAQMLKADAAPTWNFRVLNNTNGDALYAMDGSSFNSGTAASTRNLHAPTGWGSTSYTGTRAAAPFAILDTVFEAKELILSAEATRSLPELDLFWSSSNRNTSECTDDGNIGTTFYTTGGGDDGCGTSTDLAAGIYVLGDFAGGNGDTDEFDAHVIAHEFGHYYEDQFSRSDSVGGDHAGDDHVDFRLAFGEGWGNAFSGMTIDDPEYRDSYEGVDTDFGFDMEADDQSPEGWYSEVSISELLWDIYDSGSEPSDTLALGFGPIHQAMTGGQRTTAALTSIFSFSEALRAASPTSSSGLNTLLAAENISSTDEFAAGETNDAGDAELLPLYDEDLVLNQQPRLACSRSTFGVTGGNRLGNRRYLRFGNDVARTVTIQVSGALGEVGTVAATDPDLFVYERGFLAADIEQGNATLSLDLDAGTHIIEVYDFNIRTEPSTTRCMTVSISGN